MREAARHSWTAYEAFAWGKDELMPLSHGSAPHAPPMAPTLVQAACGHKARAYSVACDTRTRAHRTAHPY